MNLSITMSKTMYDLLLKGRKGSADTLYVNGCGTPEKVAEYVNATFGLLGRVTEVIVE